MKRIILLLLALTLCLFSCAKQEGANSDTTASSGGIVNEGGNSANTDDNTEIKEDGNVAKLFDAIANTLSQNNVTLTIDLTGDPDASIPTVDVKADLQASALTFAYTEAYNGRAWEYTCGYDDGYYYEGKRVVTAKNNGLLHGNIYDMSSEDSGAALHLLTAVFEDHSQINADNIADIIFGSILGGTADNPVTDHVANYVMKGMADEKWLSELAGLTVTEDGNTVTYTIAPDIYGLATDLIAYLDGKIDSEDLTDAKADLEKEKDNYNSAKINIIIKVTDGLLSEVKLGTNLTNASKSEAVSRATAPSEQSSILMTNLVLTFTDYGTTETPIEALKQALNDAHNGHTNCVICGDDVYFACYCYSCSYDYLCTNFCGNARGENTSYCDECYTPCQGCGTQHGSNYGYCYDCYSRTYCNEGCGKLATNKIEGYTYGYCDDCYTPCPDCGKQGSESYNGYCYDCGTEKFCYECRENGITHQVDDYGYCDDCYAPCPECSKQGDDYYNGYCHDCSRAKFCSNCRQNPITHAGEYENGYCDDCFTPCKQCGKHTGSYSYDYKGYCYECYFDIYCGQCRENEITHRPEGHYDGYCDNCYTQCVKCGIEMRNIIGNVCYECYYSKYCHQCGKKEITHGEGIEHKLCDDCYNK